MAIAGLPACAPKKPSSYVPSSVNNEASPWPLFASTAAANAVSRSRNLKCATSSYFSPAIHSGQQRLGGEPIMASLTQTRESGFFVLEEVEAAGFRLLATLLARTSI